LQFSLTIKLYYDILYSIPIEGIFHVVISHDEPPVLTGWLRKGTYESTNVLK